MGLFKDDEKNLSAGRLVDKKAKAEKLLIILSDYYQELKHDVESGMFDSSERAKLKDEIESLSKQHKEAQKNLNETRKKHEDDSKSFEDWKQSQIRQIELMKAAAQEDKMRASEIRNECNAMKETLHREKEEFARKSRELLNSERVDLEKKRQEVEERNSRVQELVRER